MAREKAGAGQWVQQDFREPVAAFARTRVKHGMPRSGERGYGPLPDLLPRQWLQAYRVGEAALEDQDHLPHVRRQHPRGPRGHPRGDAVVRPGEAAAMQAVVSASPPTDTARRSAPVVVGLQKGGECHRHGVRAAAGEAVTPADVVQGPAQIVAGSAADLGPDVPFGAGPG